MVALKPINDKSKLSEDSDCRGNKSAVFQDSWTEKVMSYSVITIGFCRLRIRLYRFLSIPYLWPPSTKHHSSGNPIIWIRLYGRGCSASVSFPSSAKYWPPNPESFLPVPHFRPFSAVPSPLIMAKFMSRDRRCHKGKADWTELSSPAVFLLISGGNQQQSVSSQSPASIPADSCCVRKNHPKSL